MATWESVNNNRYDKINIEISVPTFSQKLNLGLSKFNILAPTPRMKVSNMGYAPPQRREGAVALADRQADQGGFDDKYDAS